MSSISCDSETRRSSAEKPVTIFRRWSVYPNNHLLYLANNPQMGAIQFIENMDRTTLTITDDEFEQNVEAAVSAIAEKHRSQSPPPPPPPDSEKLKLPNPRGSGPSSARPSLDISRPVSPRQPASPTTEPPDSGGEYSGSDEKAAITGLLRSIQKPLSTIGRIFSDEPVPSASSSSASAAGPAGGASIASPARTPQPPEDLRARQRLSAEEAAARQASAEVAEAQRLHRAEHDNVVETLAGMFPDLDREVISDVVYQQEGRYVTAAVMGVG